MPTWCQSLGHLEKNTQRKMISLRCKLLYDVVMCQDQVHRYNNFYKAY
jgi:hypothetical protein